MSLLKSIPDTYKVDKRIQKIIASHEFTDREVDKLTELKESYAKLYEAIEKIYTSNEQWRKGEGRTKYNAYHKAYRLKKKEEEKQKAI